MSSLSRFCDGDILKPDKLMLPTAYSFVLERCQAASFMSVEVEATDANYAVKDALSSTSMLKSVKQLIVAAEGHCGINTQIGFHFYDACPNLQVISNVTAYP